MTKLTLSSNTNLFFQSIIKYRVILNGFAYALLGIPSRDLEKTWYNVNEVSTQSNHSSTLLDPQIIATITNVRQY